MWLVSRRAVNRRVPPSRRARGNRTDFPVGSLASRPVADHDLRCSRTLLRSRRRSTATVRSLAIPGASRGGGRLTPPTHPTPAPPESVAVPGFRPCGCRRHRRRQPVTVTGVRFLGHGLSRLPLRRRRRRTGHGPGCCASALAERGSRRHTGLSRIWGHRGIPPVVSLAGAVGFAFVRPPRRRLTGPTRAQPRARVPPVAPPVGFPRGLSTPVSSEHPTKGLGIGLPRRERRVCPILSRPGFAPLSRRKPPRLRASVSAAVTSPSPDTGGLPEASPETGASRGTAAASLPCSGECHYVGCSSKGGVRRRPEG
jgi:hypothetical protein